jgi:hypothetical protein
VKQANNESKGSNLHQLRQDMVRASLWKILSTAMAGKPNTGHGHVTYQQTVHQASSIAACFKAEYWLITRHTTSPERAGRHKGYTGAQLSDKSRGAKQNKCLGRTRRVDENKITIT